MALSPSSSLWLPCVSRNPLYRALSALALSKQLDPRSRTPFLGTLPCRDTVPLRSCAFLAFSATACIDCLATAAVHVAQQTCGAQRRLRAACAAVSRVRTADRKRLQPDQRRQHARALARAHERKQHPFGERPHTVLSVHDHAGESVRRDGTAHSEARRVGRTRHTRCNDDWQRRRERGYRARSATLPSAAWAATASYTAHWQRTCEAIARVRG